jgi:hypothetical protein
MGLKLHEVMALKGGQRALLDDRLGLVVAARNRPTNQGDCSLSCELRKRGLCPARRLLVALWRRAVRPSTDDRNCRKSRREPARW